MENCVKFQLFCVTFCVFPATNNNEKFSVRY